MDIKINFTVNDKSADDLVADITKDVKETFLSALAQGIDPETLGFHEVKEENSASPELAADNATEDDSINLNRVILLRCGIKRLENYTAEIAVPGTRLKAVREADNQYDKWAIKIYTQSGTPLGYIPAIKNQSTARLMDAGKHISVYVDDPSYTDVNIDHYTYGDPRLPLVIYMDIAQKETEK